MRLCCIWLCMYVHFCFIILYFVRNDKTKERKKIVSIKALCFHRTLKNIDGQLIYLCYITNYDAVFHILKAIH